MVEPRAICADGEAPIQTEEGFPNLRCPVEDGQRLAREDALDQPFRGRQVLDLFVIKEIEALFVLDVVRFIGF